MALQCSKIEKTVQFQLCALNAKINKLIFIFMVIQFEEKNSNNVSKCVNCFQQTGLFLHISRFVGKFFADFGLLWGALD